MDSADRSVAEVQLEGYFVAALAFIDAQLTPATGLAEIESAAARRRQSLDSLPPQLAEGDLEQLREAVEFVRRYHARLSLTDPEPAGAATTAPEAPEAGGYVADVALLANDSAIEVTALPEPEAGHSNGNGVGESNGNGHALWDDGSRVSPIEERPVQEAPAGEAATFTHRRRSPLSKLWEDTDCDESASCDLPEQQVLPVARGLLLLAGEAWLALFAGWVATRFMAWPREGVGYEVSPLFGHVMVLVGVATCAVSAWLIWRYRITTGRISALVNAGAILVLIDLMAWKTAAAPGNVPVIDGPGLAQWELLVAGWLLAAITAYLVDARSR